MSLKELNLEGNPTLKLASDALARQPPIDEDDLKKRQLEKTTIEYNGKIYI